MPPSARRRLAWPLPALAAWAMAWALFIALGRLGSPPWLAATAATAAGLGLAAFASTRWRVWVVAAGFPASLLATSIGQALPAWAWLLPLGLLWLLYPRYTWRDAPLFPTPQAALDELAACVPLSSGDRALDAGCGLGHGLRALHRAYPHARIDGVEWSGPLALIARWRCRFASVRRGDMWTLDWSAYQLVYLFQRPESMPRALAKAGAEMRRGTWLASLEFEAAGWQAQAVLRCPDGRSLWLYRLPPRVAPASSGGEAGR